MLGEKRGESLFFQTEKAAEPKPVVMELQMVERGVQAVESHQPDHNRISATGTLNHPQKENKRPGMPTDRKDDGMEVQEEEWEEDITVGFVPGNGGPRNQDLFFSAREGREFTQVLQEVQEYVSSKYATLLTGHDDADVKAQIKRYITKYIQNYRIAVQGMTMVQLVDTLYTEMAEFSFLTKYIFGTGIEEVDVNSWNDIEVQYSNGRNEKLEEHFDSPEHAINVIRRMLHVSGMVLDNASPAVLGHLSKNIRIAVLKTPLVDEDVGICASIRIVNPQSMTQADFVKGGTATGEMLDFLAECIRYGISVCVAGATSSGKTTLAGWVLTTVPDSKRIFTIENGSRELDLVRVKEGKVMNRVIHTLTRDSDETLMSLVTEAFPIIVFSKQLEDRKRKVMEIMECEILPDGNRNYRTLYHYNIVENRLEGDRFIIHGEHERVQGISESLKKRFLENGMPKEQLVRWEGEEA